MQIPQKESAALRFLYHTPIGRLLLKPLCSRTLSRLAGAWMDSSLSKPMIRSFIRKNNIDLSDYLPETYRSFNDCFTRRIRPELRPIDPDPNVLISPCDGNLSAYHILDGTVFPIKQSVYTVNSLLGNDPVAQRYKNGVCLVFRLCVHHYHRYAFPADGEKEESVFLPGKLHTVRPIALERYPVFVQNCREYTVLNSDRFGILTQIEVGAMFVGKIKNHKLPARVQKGQEKGMFLYGGSTVVLLVENGAADFPEEWFRCTEKGEEIPVFAGQALGKRIS